MILKVARILLLCVIITCSQGVLSQVKKESSKTTKVYTKKELELKKKRLLQEIAATQKILDETRENKENTLQQLVALNKQITARENLINTISSELKVLDRQITERQAAIVQLSQQLVQLKKEYSAMIMFAQRNQSSYNKLMFIFAADNFNQAYKRLKYIQQFNNYRRKQVEYIMDTQVDLRTAIAELEIKKQGKNLLLNDEQKEKVKLDKDKKKQAELAKQFQEKEKQLRKELTKKEDQVQRLNKAIEDAIKREIEAVRKKAEEEARKKAIAAGKPIPKTQPTSTSNALTATPEALKLSNEFAGNRGKLPWPVEKGMITESFGVHPHPVLKGVMIQSNGINIQTEMNAAARAAFDGEIRSVFSVPGQNKSVMIRHGEYFTIYSNLVSTNVKTGDKVTAKQVIGTVYAVPGKNVSEIHFEIWKSFNKLNPAEWLAGGGS